MPCDSRDRVDCLIQSDRSFVKTCAVLYGAVLVVCVLSVFILHHWANSAIPPYSGALFSGLAIPMVVKHIQRSGALKILHMLKSECERYDENDPKCQRIWDDVDSLLRARGGV